MSQEVEIRISDHVIKGTLVSAESEFLELPPIYGWQTFGKRKSVTIKVKVDG